MYTSDRVRQCTQVIYQQGCRRIRILYVMPKKYANWLATAHCIGGVHGRPLHAPHTQAHTSVHVPPLQLVMC